MICWDNAISKHVSSYLFALLVVVITTDVVCILTDAIQYNVLFFTSSIPV